jgi:hypothetical protein
MTLIGCLWFGTLTKHNMNKDDIFDSFMTCLDVVSFFFTICFYYVPYINMKEETLSPN